MSVACNRLSVDGELVELDSLRYTPAGVARIALKIRHASTQLEAGIARHVQCDIPALALGAAAQQANNLQLGQRVKAEGFWLSAVYASHNLCCTLITLH